MGLLKEKLIVFCVAVFSVVIGIAGCDVAKTSDFTPEQLYSKDSNVDMFIYKDTAYVNATDIDWVQNETFEKGKYIGEIKDSGVTKDLGNWDATVLSVGTGIYESSDSQILLVSYGEQLIPYLKWVEG